MEIPSQADLFRMPKKLGKKSQFSENIGLSTLRGSFELPSYDQFHAFNLSQLLFMKVDRDLPLSSLNLLKVETLARRFRLCM